MGGHVGHVRIYVGRPLKFHLETCAHGPTHTTASVTPPAASLPAAPAPSTAGAAALVRLAIAPGRPLAAPAVIIAGGLEVVGRFPLEQCLELRQRRRHERSMCAAAHREDDWPVERRQLPGSQAPGLSFAQREAHHPLATSDLVIERHHVSL